MELSALKKKKKHKETLVGAPSQLLVLGGRIPLILLALYASLNLEIWVINLLHRELIDSLLKYHSSAGSIWT